MITIAKLITVGYPAVLAAIKGGQDWTDPHLNMLARKGRILSGNSGFEFENLTIPMVWTPKDELENLTENDKVSFATRMLENVLGAHDDTIIDKMGQGKVIISKKHRYEFEPVETMMVRGMTHYVAKVRTRLAFIA